MELSNAWHEAIVSATIAAAWIFSLFGGYLSGNLQPFVAHPSN